MRIPRDSTATLHTLQGRDCDYFQGRWSASHLPAVIAWATRRSTASGPTPADLRATLNPIRGWAWFGWFKALAGQSYRSPAAARTGKCRLLPLAPNRRGVGPGQLGPCGTVLRPRIPSRCRDGANARLGAAGGSQWEQIDWVTRPSSVRQPPDVIRRLGDRGVFEYGNR